MARRRLQKLSSGGGLGPFDPLQFALHAYWTDGPAFRALNPIAPGAQVTEIPEEVRGGPSFVPVVGGIAQPPVQDWTGKFVQFDRAIPNPMRAYTPTPWTFAPPYSVVVGGSFPEGRPSEASGSYHIWAQLSGAEFRGMQWPTLGWPTMQFFSGTGTNGNPDAYINLTVQPELEPEILDPLPAWTMSYIDPVYNTDGRLIANFATQQESQIVQTPVYSDNDLYLGATGSYTGADQGTMWDFRFWFLFPGDVREAPYWPELQDWMDAHCRKPIYQPYGFVAAKDSFGARGYSALGEDPRHVPVWPDEFAEMLYADALSNGQYPIWNPARQAVTFSDSPATGLQSLGGDVVLSPWSVVVGARHGLHPGGDPRVLVSGDASGDTFVLEMAAANGINGGYVAAGRASVSHSETGEHSVWYVLDASGGTTTLTRRGEAGDEQTDSVASTAPIDSDFVLGGRVANADADAYPGDLFFAYVFPFNVRTSPQWRMLQAWMDRAIRRWGARPPRNTGHFQQYEARGIDADPTANPSWTSDDFSSGDGAQGTLEPMRTTANLSRVVAPNGAWMLQNSGTGYVRTRTNWSLGPGFSVCLLGQFDDVTGTLVLFDAGSLGANRLLGYTINGRLVVWSTGTVTIDVTDTELGIPFALGISSNGTESLVHYSSATRTVKVRGTLSDLGLDGLTLFAQQDGQFPLAGKVGEVTLFDRPLSESDLEREVDNMARWWGIQSRSTARLKVGVQGDVAGYTESGLGSTTETRLWGARVSAIIADNTALAEALSVKFENAIQVNGWSDLYVQLDGRGPAKLAWSAGNNQFELDDPHERAYMHSKAGSYVDVVFAKEWPIEHPVSSAVHLFWTRGPSFKGNYNSTGAAIPSWPNEMAAAYPMTTFFPANTPVHDAEGWADFWNIAASGLMATEILPALPAESTHVIGFETLSGHLAANQIILSRILEFNSPSMYFGSVFGQVSDPSLVFTRYGINPGFEDSPEVQMGPTPYRGWMFHEPKPSLANPDGPTTLSQDRRLDVTWDVAGAPPAYTVDPRYAIAGGGNDLASNRAPVRVRFAMVFPFNVRRSVYWGELVRWMNKELGL